MPAFLQPASENIMFKHASKLSVISLSLLAAMPAFADKPETEDSADSGELQTVTVTASADASKGGLVPAFRGGQVARGSRVGILGNKNNLESPFSNTAYTNRLIQDKHARSVGDVLQNDPHCAHRARFRQFPGILFHTRFRQRIRRHHVQRPLRHPAAPVHRHRAV